MSFADASPHYDGRHGQLEVGSDDLVRADLDARLCELLKTGLLHSDAVHTYASKLHVVVALFIGDIGVGGEGTGLHDGHFCVLNRFAARIGDSAD